MPDDDAGRPRAMAGVGQGPSRVGNQIIEGVVIAVNDVAIPGEVQAGSAQIGMQRVAGIWLAEADADAAAGGIRHRCHCFRPVQDRVHPIQRRRVVRARIVTERIRGVDTWLDVHRHRHIRLNPAELLAAGQRQSCLVRLAGVLGGADGVLARAGEQHQPAAASEPLHAPADAKSSLSDLVYLGIVLSRFW